MAINDILEKLVSLCPDGIIGVDRSGTITIFNDAAEHLTGYTREEVIGKMSITEVYHPATLARHIKKMIFSPEYGGIGRLEGFEVEVGTKTGGKVPIRLSATLLYEEGNEIGSVGFFHDLTARKEIEAKLKLLSITDGLTGLYNNRHFHFVLEEELERCRRYERPVSLICFDLDNFKMCNDMLGHLEGDNVLRLVGDILKSMIRRADRAFRYGGDEFMLLLPETDLQGAFQTAERIRYTFNSRWPHSALFDDKYPVNVSLSLGVAEADEEYDGRALVKRADMAMYDSKKAGGDRTTEARAA